MYQMRHSNAICYGFCALCCLLVILSNYILPHIQGGKAVVDALELMANLQKNNTD